MDPQAFLRILAPYLDTMEVVAKKEILHNIALAMEEYGDVNSNEIRAIMRKHNTDMPKEMRCQECLVDYEDTILDCDWCGRYFHTKCAKYDTIHCSKKCSSIDHIKNRS
jgi:hypothetical protein